MSKGIDTLRYNHTLSNGEDLILSLAFSRNLDNEESYIERCKYMYNTMKNAIEDYETKLRKIK